MPLSQLIRALELHKKNLTDSSKPIANRQKYAQTSQDALKACDAALFKARITAASLTGDTKKLAILSSTLSRNENLEADIIKLKNGKPSEKTVVLDKALRPLFEWEKKALENRNNTFLLGQIRKWEDIMEPKSFDPDSRKFKAEVKMFEEQVVKSMKLRTEITRAIESLKNS